MWHKQKNKNSIVRLALLLALTSTPMINSLFKSDYVLAQSPVETPSFPLPTAVPDGTTIRIDGSASMTRANELLKQRFEDKYSGTNVEITASGTEDALKALLTGEVDIAAIGRDLTPQEESQGLQQQRLRREKIAIVVGKNNPFKGDLTNQQFTRIYRGEITDWSQLGAPGGRIRVIDRPDFSDTRQAFRNYPLFEGNRFRTGSTATQLDSDDPAQVVNQLGDDGIGFVLANQVSKLDNVRILSMHKTLPDDPRYPYSQPLVYVFKQNPSEAVQNFVGFATAKPGHEAIEAAREQEATAVAQAVAQAVSEQENATATATPTPTTTATATTGEGQTTTTGNQAATNTTQTETVGTVTNTSASDTNVTGDQALLPGNATGAAEVGEGRMPLWLILLLPVAVLGALILWWMLGRRRSQEDDTVARGVLPDDAPPPFTPTSTSTSGAVKQPEPIINTPVEPNGAADINAAPVEPAANPTQPVAGVNAVPVEPTPNTTPGINVAGIAGAAAGLGIGAAALSSRDKNADKNNAPDDRENSNLNPAPIASKGLDIETSNLQQPDIPDTGLDLEAPAAVVNNSYPALPLISQPTDGQTQSAEQDNSTSPGTNTSTPENQSNPAANSWLGNFTLGAAAGAKKIKSKLANNVPESVTESNHETAVEPQHSEETASETQLNPENQTSPYPQLPDVWDTPQTTSTPEQDAGVTAQNLEENNPEKPAQEQPQTLSPSDLWGTPPTEESNTTQQENPFSLGTTAAAAALGSRLLNQDSDNASDDKIDDNNSEDLPKSQPTQTAANLETPPTEQDSATEKGGIGSRWWNRFTQKTPDQSDTVETPPIAGEQPQVTEAKTTPAPGLPEVRITSPNEQLADTQETPAPPQTTTDGLPNVWVTPSNSQPQTTQETTPENIDNADTTVDSEPNNVIDKVSATGAAVGAFLLGSQMLDNNKTEDEKSSEHPVTDELQASQESFSEDLAIDPLPEETEADTDLLVPTKQNSNIQESAWDKIYGIRHNRNTAVPGESNILLSNRTPKWAYASWNIAADDKQTMRDRGGIQLVLRLYDVTNIDLSYQEAKLVQQYECEETVSHRYVAIPSTDRDYIAEIGYFSKNKDWLLVSRSPIVRVFSRPHQDFWFEADAELIIHGATEPGSTVNIDGHNIKVKQDGTFHLRVPFTESKINYLITAVSPESEQARTIHMQFSQSERKNT